MATENDTGNLEVQKQINEVISARNALLVKQSELIRGQVLLAIELNKSLKSENAEEIVKNVNEITKGLKAASGAAETATKSMEGAAAAAKTAADSVGGIAAAAGDAATKLKRVGKAAKTAEEAAKSLGEQLGEAFSKTGAQMDSLFSMIGSITTGIFGIGSAILSIPLKVFGILTEKAAELSNSSQALREAYENVRETFGDLNKAEAKGVINSFNQLQSSGGGLAGTGLSLARIYGHGPEGLAAALNELNETAAAMGPVFGVLQGQFEQNADKILVMQKGMGLGSEEMKALGQVAIATGGDLTQMMQEMGNLALQMGEKFGISSKLLGKDLGYMATNMGKFGSMTKTQMITSAVYVRKLGLEIKDIEGLMGAFDNFEDAAQNAAKLAQGFGMTIDAMKMMKEQDPAKRLDMLRQAFAATGKSIETMSRQEKAMLASSAGLDENMVSLALSSKNMGKSYDDIQREADKSNKKQLSQAEVMDKLSENIKRMTEALETSGSFLTQFFNGMMKGFSRTPEFQRLMRNLARALELTMKFGMEVGKMIMDVFPGMKEMFGGLADFFAPGRFSKLIDGLRESFKSFFDDLQTDPVRAVEKFMKNMKEKFFGFFDKDSDSGKKFLGGMDKFGKAMGGIFAGIGKYLIEAAVGAIKGLIDFIKNPSVPAGAPVGFAENFFAPILQVLKDQGPVLLGALKDLVLTVLAEFGPWIIGIGAALFAMNIAKALVIGVVTGAAQAGGMAIMQKALKSFGMGIVDQATPPAGGGGPEKGMIEKLKESIDVLKDMKRPDIVKAGVNMLLLAAFVAGAMVEFAIGMALAAAVMSLVSMENVIKAFMAVTAGLMAAIALVLVSKLLPPGAATSAILPVLEAAAFVSVGMVGFAIAVALAAGIMSLVSWDSIAKAFAAVGFGILATIALIGVGALLGTAPVQAAMGIGIMGLIAGAIFVTVGLLAYAAAIRLTVFAMGDVPFQRVAEVFASVGMAILATAALLAIGVEFAILALSGAALLATGGMIAAAAFMSIGIYAFAQGLRLAVNAVGDIDIGKVTEVLAMVGIGIMAAFGLLAAGGVVAALAIFAGPTLIMAAAGIYALALFFSTVLPLFTPALQAVSEMPMANAEEVSAKIKAIGAIIEAMSSIGKLGLDAGSLAIDSGDIEGTMTQMSKFIMNTKEAIVSLVTDLAGMALKWSKKEMEKIKLMADVVGGVANLASALTGPMTALASAETGWLSDNSQERVDSIMKGMGGIMGSLKDEIPALLTAVLNTTIPEGVGPNRVKLISSAIKAIVPLVQAVGGMVKDLVGTKGDTLGTDAAEKMGTVGTSISNVFDAIANTFPNLVSKIMEVGKNTKNMNELPNIIKTMSESIKMVIASVKELSELNYGAEPGMVEKLKNAMGMGKTPLEDVFKKMDADLGEIDKAMQSLTGDRIDSLTKSSNTLKSYSELQLGGVVRAITEDIKAVNDALADLGSVDVNATIDHLGEALQLKTEVLNIERKPIQMNVTLNLTMKAEDIAKEILEVSQKATLKSNSKLYNTVQDFLGRS